MTDHSDIDHTGLTGVGAAAFSGARVYNNASQSISTSTWTSITFNSERFDTDSYHDTGSNTSRLTIPSNGYYLVGACLEFVTNTTGSRFARFWVDGTTRIGEVSQPPAAGSNPTRLNPVVVYQFTAAQYVEVQMFQDSGSSRDSAVTANSAPEFWIVKLG